MSLYYPASDPTSRGKTTEREDRHTAGIVELAPPHKIVEAIIFETVDPAFQGEILLEITLEAEQGGSRYYLQNGAIL